MSRFAQKLLATQAARTLVRPKGSPYKGLNNGGLDQKTFNLSEQKARYTFHEVYRKPSAAHKRAMSKGNRNPVGCPVSKKLSTGTAQESKSPLWGLRKVAC